MFCFQQQASQTPTLTPEWTQTQQEDKLQVWTPGRRRRPAMKVVKPLASFWTRRRPRRDIPVETFSSGGPKRGRLLVLVSRETDTNKQA